MACMVRTVVWMLWMDGLFRWLLADLSDAVCFV